MSNIATNNKLDYLETVKADIKAAIIEKGQAVADTDTFKSYADKIRAISGGASGDAVVWFVTFIGGDGTQLYKMPVLDGDDCKDPYTTGKINKPTKASNVQYDYTYSGWSLTEGGSNDTNALKAVTEDRIVHAAFTSAVRYYTITYYDADGSTVLKTESLAYGSMPKYVGDKSGYSFVGWQPELTTVTGNASYIAQWEARITFAAGSWADIADISERGEARNYFSIGEERRIPITFAGVSYDALFRIAGFDHDDLADGSGKAGMTIVLHELKLAVSQAIGVSGTTQYSNWTKLPIYTHIQEAVLPSELTAVIKTVTKHYPTSSGSNVTGDFNRFMLSAEEAGCTEYSGTSSNKVYTTEDTVYELYQTNVLGTKDTTTEIVYDNGSYTNYGNSALRNISSSGRYCEVNQYDGHKYCSPNSNSNGKACGVFGFCI